MENNNAGGISMKTPFITTISDVPDGMFVFSADMVAKIDGAYTINLFTTGRYILKIDGIYICEGPCKSHQHIRYYDTVTHWLDFGVHRIEVAVLHIGTANQWRLTSVFKSSKPQMIFRAKCADYEFHSSASWNCVRMDGYLLKHHSWNIPGEDMFFGHTQTAYELKEDEFFDFDLGTQTDTGVDRSGGLQPRPIPMLTHGEEIHFDVVKSGNGFVELDAGCYVTAKVSLSLAANTQASVTYAECYERSGRKTLRDDTTGTLVGLTEIVQTPEKTVWEPFWIKAFRYIRIETSQLENILAVRAWRWNYPMVHCGEFSCSDNRLNQIYSISTNTLRCCCFDTFIDCPFYEQEQYIMDSTIEAAALMKYTGDTSLVQKCIEEFAASQTEDGILLSSYPDDYRQIIPGFGFFWVYLLYDYLEYSSDFDFARQFSGTMDKLLWYYECRMSEDGLIEKSIWWDFADWVPGWKQGEPVSDHHSPITLYSMYYACALKKAAEINRRIGRNALAEEYLIRYDRIKEAVKKHCLDSDGYYCDSKSGSAKSVHCGIWAILSGIEDTDYGQMLLDAIGHPSFKQPSFCMHFFLFRALEACGMADRIFGLLGHWQRMLDLHCTTWCENPDNPRSECHGWSVAPMHECAANLLGVRTGFENEIIIKPVKTDLKWVSGSVNTRYGTVHVERNGCSIHITAPDGIPKKLVSPDGNITVFRKSEFQTIF